MEERERVAPEGGELGAEKVSRQYCDGIGIDEHLCTWIYGDDGTTVARTLWHHENARGDTVALTDEQGGVVASFVYSAYGEVAQINAEGNLEPVQNFSLCVYYFQGRELDTETGYLYFRNRYYDPAQGRFIQRDPIMSDLYWYEAFYDSPYYFNDPWGLQSGFDVMFDQGPLAEEARRHYQQVGAAGYQNYDEYIDKTVTIHDFNPLSEYYTIVTDTLTPLPLVKDACKRYSTANPHIPYLEDVKEDLVAGLEIAATALWIAGLRGEIPSPKAAKLPCPQKPGTPSPTTINFRGTYDPSYFAKLQDAHRRFLNEGMDLTEHALNRLSKVKNKGVTFEQIVDAFKTGQKFKDPKYGTIIKLKNKVAVSLDPSNNNLVVNIQFQKKGPTSRWIPEPE